jgi:hypothetical protein
MRALTTAIILAILAPLVQPAFAAESEALTHRSDQQKKEDEEVDKAYKAATRGANGPAAKVDPWATVRPADTDKKKKP